MRARGPRGLATGRPLKPIAWGSVAWGVDGAQWVSCGGEFLDPVDTADPTTTALRLARQHRSEDLHVVVTPNSATHVYELRGVRNQTPGVTGIAVLAAGINADYSVLVFAAESQGYPAPET